MPLVVPLVFEPAPAPVVPPLASDGRPAEFVPVDGRVLAPAEFALFEAAPSVFVGLLAG